MERISLLIVDEHLQVHAQMLVRLNREADFKIVGVATDITSAVRTASETQPRVILIDPMMRDGSGLEAICRLRQVLPDTVIVVLTAFSDTAQRIELEKMGVHFILNKGIASSKLIQELYNAAHYTNGNCLGNAPESNR